MDLASKDKHGFSQFLQITTSLLLVTAFLPVCTNAKGSARTPDPAISPMMNTAVVHTVNPSGFPTDYKKLDSFQRVTFEPNLFQTYYAM